MRKIVIVEIILTCITIFAIFYIASWYVSDEYNKSKKGEYKEIRYFTVIPACEDKVICYKNYSGGMDCFRDEDLIDKYCK